MLTTPQIVTSPYWRNQPTTRQWKLLYETSKVPGPRNILFGGAAGGGKSEVLLFVAAQWAQFPDFHTLILRKSFSDLNQQGAIMQRARDEWWPDLPFSPIERRITFPSGATATFGHMNDSSSHLQYQGAEYHAALVDESTQIPEHQIRFVSGRLRHNVGCPVPTRLVLTSNPGGISHHWHKTNFVDGTDPDFKFIQSRLSDNPHLEADYEDQLKTNLDPVLLAQWLHGDWDVRIETGFLEVKKVAIVHEAPFKVRSRARVWDFAATENDPHNSKQEPDYTAGMLLAYGEGQVCIEDLVHLQEAPGKVEKTLLETAEMDGRSVTVYAEQEPGASGKWVIADLGRKLTGIAPFRGLPSTGSKPVRARMLASTISNGNMSMIEAPWNTVVLDQWGAFPSKGMHDDTVDVAAYGVIQSRRSKVAIG